MQWEAFSVPELRNFLEILNREEDEYVDQIKAKYSLMQIHITRRMQQLRKDATADTDDVTRTLANTTFSPEADSARSRTSKSGSVLHGDTPRPAALQEARDSFSKESSPSCVTFQEDDREGVFV